MAFAMTGTHRFLVGAVIALQLSNTVQCLCGLCSMRPDAAQTPPNVVDWREKAPAESETPCCLHASLRKDVESMRPPADPGFFTFVQGAPIAPGRIGVRFVPPHAVSQRHRTCAELGVFRT